MIAVDHLTKRYGTVVAVDGLGFEVRQPNGMAIARRAVVLAGRCGTGDDRYSRRVGSRGRRGPGWPGADAGQVAGPVVVPGPGRPDVPAQRRADAPMAAAGLGVLVVCGVLVANRTVLGTDVAVFRRVNHWPGWLYPIWTVQLSRVIGVLPLVAAATLLKAWLEAWPRWSCSVTGQRKPCRM